MVVTMAMDWGRSEKGQPAVLDLESGGGESEERERERESGGGQEGMRQVWSGRNAGGCGWSSGGGWREIANEIDLSGSTIAHRPITF